MVAISYGKRFKNLYAVQIIIDKVTVSKLDDILNIDTGLTLNGVLSIKDRFGKEIFTVTSGETKVSSDNFISHNIKTAQLTGLDDGLIIDSGFNKGGNIKLEKDRRVNITDLLNLSPRKSPPIKSLRGDMYLSSADDKLHLLLSDGWHIIQTKLIIPT